MGKLVNTRPGPKEGEQLIPGDTQDPQRGRSTRTPGDVKERWSRSPSPWLRGMDRLILEEGYGEMESTFLEGAMPHPRAIDSPYWETTRRRGDDSTGPGEGRSRAGGGDRASRDSYESRRIPRGSRKDYGSYYETPGVPIPGNNTRKTGVNEQ